MTHLTETEFVDLVDGVLPDARVAHLGRCDVCRSQADTIRAGLAHAAASDVPEPSPLFWSHLSANIREAIAEQSVDQTGWFGWLRSGRAWPLAATLATLVLVAGVWRAASTRSPRTTSAASVLTAAPTVSSATNGSDAGIDDDIEADEAWALVRTVADEVPWDQTHDLGISPRPGSAERIALELTPAERKELARLLEDELKRSGA